MIAFESLSFDIFFEISTYLDIDDIAHLAQTCLQLRALLLDNTLARRIVEVGIISPADASTTNVYLRRITHTPRKLNRSARV